MSHARIQFDMLQLPLLLSVLSSPSLGLPPADLYSHMLMRASMNRAFVRGMAAIALPF